MEPETTGANFENLLLTAESPIAAALADSGVPKLYTNGFQIFHTDSDTGILFMRVGEPVAVLFMSNILGKTLAQKLSYSMDELEKSLESTFAVTDELKEARETMAKTKEKESDDDNSGT